MGSILGYPNFGKLPMYLNSSRIENSRARGLQPKGSMYPLKGIYRV